MDKKIEKIIDSQLKFGDDWYRISRQKIVDQIMELFQAQHEQDIKAFEEILGEDENEFNKDHLYFQGKNDLRAELRTKLDKYKNGII